MKLTQEQQDMLDGKYGKGTAYAMKIQVAIGESFDAESGILSGFFQKSQYGGAGICRSDAENTQCIQSHRGTAYL